MFYVVGDGSEGPKRDPYARELQTPFPSECIIRSSDFPWHDSGFVTPPFHDFVIYQLHVGTFFTPNLPRKGGTFLDVARKIPYLAEPRRDGDSADADPGVPDRVQPRLQRHRLLLARDGFRGRGRGRWRRMSRRSTGCSTPRGCRAIDVDGPARRDESAQGAGRSVPPSRARRDARSSSTTTPAAISATRACISSTGSRPDGGNRNSLYFTDKGHAGGLVFDFGKPEVRDFLIQNAKFFLDEYRVDGFRYDQVSVIDHDGAPHGWSFCQDLTSTLHAHRPGVVRQGRVLERQSVRS